MEWILDGSGLDFLSMLEPFWEACWHQVGTKIQKKRLPKRCQKMSGKKLMQVSGKGGECRRVERRKWGSGPLKTFKNNLGTPYKPTNQEM